MAFNQTLNLKWLRMKICCLFRALNKFLCFVFGSYAFMIFPYNEIKIKNLLTDFKMSLVLHNFLSKMVYTYSSQTKEMLDVFLSLVIES